jgi:hypothetical protein
MGLGCACLFEHHELEWALLYKVCIAHRRLRVRGSLERLPYNQPISFDVARELYSGRVRPARWAKHNFNLTCFVR